MLLKCPPPTWFRSVKRTAPYAAFYLEGAYDGILQAVVEYGGTRLVCAPQEPNAAQLREYFLTANMMAGTGHEADPAINMAYVAFKVAMPCK